MWADGCHEVSTDPGHGTIAALQTAARDSRGDRAALLEHG